MESSDDALMRVPGLLSRVVRLSSGPRIHYVTSGEDGPAVVLLHGGGPGSSGTAGWYGIAPFLGSMGFSVYCPDLPGFGSTHVTGHARAFGRSGHLRILDEFVDALCLDRFHLGGTWTGSDTAAVYTTWHPDRVASVALMAGPIGDILTQQQLRAADSRPPGQALQLPRFDGTEHSMRAVMTAISADPASITDPLVRMRTAAANRQAEAFARHQAAALADNVDNGAASLSIKGRFDALTTPGICVWGRADSLAPLDAGFALEDRLPNVQFFYPEAVGHQGHNERPDIFHPLLLEFFRDAAISADTAERAGVSHRRGAPHDRSARLRESEARLG